MSDSDIERRIVAGLIVSDEFAGCVRPLWRDDLVESPEVVRIARWCTDYFDRYARAPGRHVEDIYMRELRADRVPKAEAEIIERILARISDDYERGEQFNAAYLFDRTAEYFRSREITRHNERVQDLVDAGDVMAADEAVRAFRPASWVTSRGLDVGSEEGLRRVEEAFSTTAQPVLRYPGALGAMLNPHLVRDGFIGFQGPEKRGKSQILIDISMRSLRQRSNVAFFQAGDMSEGQFLRRIGIYVARRSDMEVYCRPYWRAVGDCVLNQLDICDRGDRNCDHGVFDVTAEQYRSDRTAYSTREALVKAAEDHPDYRPCDSASCSKRWPAAWLVEEPAVQPLSGPGARREVERFFRRYRRRFKLATYASGLLDVGEIDSCLDEWERSDDFVADVIVVDYADLMTAREAEFRHRQNEVWKNLRGLSQRRHALVVTATQSDAASYRASSLNLSHFSEDKRKYAHVTAMFALNRSPDGREEELGIIRIAEMVVREGAKLGVEVTVLQDLRRGRAYLESFAHGLRQDRSVDV